MQTKISLVALSCLFFGVQCNDTDNRPSPSTEIPADPQPGPQADPLSLAFSPLVQLFEAAPATAADANAGFENSLTDAEAQLLAEFIVSLTEVMQDEVYVSNYARPAGLTELLYQHRATPFLAALFAEGAVGPTAIGDSLGKARQPQASFIPTCDKGGCYDQAYDSFLSKAFADYLVEKGKEILSEKFGDAFVVIGEALKECRVEPCTRAQLLNKIALAAAEAVVEETLSKGLLGIVLAGIAIEEAMEEMQNYGAEVFEACYRWQRDNCRCPGPPTRNAFCINSDRCADLATDYFNCGACGRGCVGRQACENGSCVDLCPVGDTLCSGVCADTLSNRFHCGGCGIECSESESCVSGQCRPLCGDEACGALPALCSGPNEITSYVGVCRDGACVQDPTIVQCADNQICGTGVDGPECQSCGKEHEKCCWPFSACETGLECLNGTCENPDPCRSAGYYEFNCPEDSALYDCCGIQCIAGGPSVQITFEGPVSQTPGARFFGNEYTFSPDTCTVSLHSTGVLEGYCPPQTYTMHSGTFVSSLCTPVFARNEDGSPVPVPECVSTHPYACTVTYAPELTEQMCRELFADVARQGAITSLVRGYAECASAFRELLETP